MLGFYKGRGLCLKMLLSMYFRLVLERTYFLPQCTFQVVPCYRSALTFSLKLVLSYLNLEIATSCLCELLGKSIKYPVYFSSCSLLQKCIDILIEASLILLQPRNCNQLFVEAFRQKHKIPIRGKKVSFNVSVMIMCL